MCVRGPGARSRSPAPSDASPVGQTQTKARIRIRMDSSGTLATAYIAHYYRTVYSARNSDSIACRRLSSQDNWKAVSTGSRELSAISELADRARYALILDCEWRRESVVWEVTHSSQPHLGTIEIKR